MPTPTRARDTLTVRPSDRPRYPKVGGKPTTTAGSLRDKIALEEFKAHTKGLSQRLPLASVEAMRSGHVVSPHALVRRYLVSARGIGLPKEWALRFHVWVGRQIDFLWPLCQTPRRVVEEREMGLEHIANQAEKKLDLERNVQTLRARIDTQTAEIVAEQLLVAKLERELADMEAGR